MMNDSSQDIYTLQIRRQGNPNSASPFCEACKNGYLHVNSIQVRQFTQTGKLPGVCKTCNVAFLKICRMQIRHLNQPENQPHVCEKCGKSFTHAGNHRKHMLLHEKNEAAGENGKPKETHPKPPYNCERCPRSFLKYGSFLKHLANHDNPIKYICIVCKKEFKTKATLKTHSQLHKVDCGDVTCQFCKKILTPELLEGHLLFHLQDKLAEPEEVDSPEDIPQTEEDAHIEGAEQVVSNEEVIKTEDNRCKHFCSVCQKGFVNLGSLKNHFSFHTGDLPFECKKCKRRFMHAFNLRKHAKTHFKLLSCKICKKVYRNMKRFKTHLLLHTKKE